MGFRLVDAFRVSSQDVESRFLNGASSTVPFNLVVQGPNDGALLSRSSRRFVLTYRVRLVLRSCSIGGCAGFTGVVQNRSAKP